MKRNILLIALMFIVVFGINAQNNIMYVWKSGSVINKQAVGSNNVDSITFNLPINIDFVTIPAGVFVMGSPTSEIGRETYETEHQVFLSSYCMSKYEITNEQFAEFLNAKNIGSEGKYGSGEYPNEVLINASFGTSDWGLHFANNKWVPVIGYEKHPVINVTWYGAVEFASFVGGTLPTEAQWEYACRGNSTTAFNTGSCLINLLANYNWNYPYSSCTNTNNSYPHSTQIVGSYPPNSFGLFDMHGNVWEFCSDWVGSYPTSTQVNPTGPTTTANHHVIRGGSWTSRASDCRSAFRLTGMPDGTTLGFRIVFVQ